MTAETPHRIDRAVREALSGPWFIHAPKFELIVEVLSRRVQGILLTPDEISAAVGTAGSTVRPTLIPSAPGRVGGGDSDSRDHRAPERDGEQRVHPWRDVD